MKRVNFLIREEQGAKRRQVETKGVKLAPQVGFEPTTLRLTASRLINKNKRLSFVFYGLPANRLRPSTLLYSHFLSLPAKEIAKVNPAFFRHVFGETLKKLIACSV